MHRLLLLGTLLLTLAGALVLSGGAARAATLPAVLHTARASTAAQELSAEAHAPATSSASTAGSEPCDGGNTPQACANALTGGLDRFFQVALLVIIRLGGAIGILVFSTLAIKGMGGVGAGEPRAVAHFVINGACVVLLLIGEVAGPWLLQVILHGIPLQLPSIQNLISN